MDNRLYQPTGSSPALSLFVAVGLGSLLAFFVGFVYNFLIVTIPIIYINIFLTIGFGVVLGYGVKFISRLLKVRNQQQTIVLAAIIGLVGWYFQWVAYLVYITSMEHSFSAYREYSSFFYNPTTFIEPIQWLSSEGSWELFGIPFNGPAIWAVWLVEAVFIIGIPSLIIYKHPIIPFSEQLNRWYSKITIDFQFEHIAAQNQFREKLMFDPKQTIEHLQYGQPFRFSQISLYYLKDEESQYLTIENIFVEDRGKGKHKSTSVIHLMKVDNQFSAWLLSQFKTKKAFVLDY